MSLSDWLQRTAPSLEDFEALARQAYDGLPAEFRGLTGDILIRIADFPDDEALDALDLESPFDLLGLFQGIGLAQGSSTPFTGQLPNQVWLYRRPILDYWAEHEETLGHIVAHVLIHEIGHHFGLSDDDMEAIEESVAG
ncbi:Zn-dependent protease [Prosthecomicrobium hirschii]|uniref:metallopeptidase family protein n=1 Tax=Prosthecodimorpha hirschii TaxID=665126 RepID=UPI0011298996|nr:metallopeptidase family protein [Prosthecomicrobium hirschii]TPQ49819.1 Zn-dependent protease [Prosthecomicrobium hirschii]